MKFGLTEQEYTFLMEKLIIPLKQRRSRVFIFGSRATGKYKPFSDVDILYLEESNHLIPGHEIYAILTELEESRFPYKIDLVNFNELAKSYREGAEKDKIEL